MAMERIGRTPETIAAVAKIFAALREPFQKVVMQTYEELADQGMTVESQRSAAVSLVMSGTASMLLEGMYNFYTVHGQDFGPEERLRFCGEIESLVNRWQEIAIQRREQSPDNN